MRGRTSSFWLCLTGAALLLSPAPAVAEVMLTEIKNKAALTVANDLCLRFKGGIPKSVSVSDTAGENLTAGQKKSANPCLSGFEWTVGQLPSSVGVGQSVQVRYDAPGGAKVDPDTSFWTRDAAPIVGALGALAAMPRFNRENDAFVAIFNNEETFEIAYTGIELWTGNDMSRLNLLDFDGPTGTLATGLPTSLLLQPGESASFSFGGWSGPGYNLILANVEGDGDTYRVAAAMAVPVPAAALLLGSALGALGGLRRLHRSRTASAR